jgi:hypothetical protein
MKTIISIACLITWACARTFAQGSPVSLAETLLVKQEYSTAKNGLREYLKSNPNDNKALYLLNVLEQTELLDYESYSIKNEKFIAMCDSIKSIFEERLPHLTGADSIQCLFFLANVYGGKGVLLAKTGNWFAALKDAMTSITLLKEVVRLDSTIIAANLGIGVFHYYLSKSFKWLPFVDENSEIEGIEAIEKAAAAPYPYCFAAKNSLCWILIEKKDIKRADSIVSIVRREMPDNTIFLRINCLISLYNKKYDSAVCLGERLAGISKKRNPVNWSDLVLAYYTIAQGYDGQGKGKEALAAITTIKNTKIPPAYKIIPPIKKNFRKMSAIRRKYQPAGDKKDDE